MLEFKLVDFSHKSLKPRRYKVALRDWRHPVQKRIDNEKDNQRRKINVSQLGKS